MNKDSVMVDHDILVWQTSFSDAILAYVWSLMKFSVFLYFLGIVNHVGLALLC